MHPFGMPSPFRLMSRLQSTLVKRGAPRIATPPRGAGVPRLVGAAAIASGKAAELTFNDGGKFHFHALWLKDACRDEAHREVQSERKLATSPLVTRTPLDLGIERVVLEEDGTAAHVCARAPRAHARATEHAECAHQRAAHLVAHARAHSRAHAATDRDRSAERRCGLHPLLPQLSRVRAHFERHAA